MSLRQLVQPGCQNAFSGAVSGIGQFPLRNGLPSISRYAVIPSTGEAVFACEERRFGPGEELDLPSAEAARLRALGFLFDPARYASDAEAAKVPPMTPPPIGTAS